jgi:hypothetical protein
MPRCKAVQLFFSKKWLRLIRARLYHLSLHGQDYFKILVEQQSVNGSLTLVGSDGKLADVNNQKFRQESSDWQFHLQRHWPDKIDAKSQT